MADVERKAYKGARERESLLRAGLKKGSKGGTEAQTFSHTANGHCQNFPSLT